MAQSLAEFNVKVDRFTDKIAGQALRKITTKVAVEAKKDVEKQVKRDIGADEGMSGWRKGKLKFKSGFELTSDSTAKLSTRPAGPWMVLEEGRKSGWAPKRGRKTFRTPWGPRTYTATHPLRIGPTKGKHTFQEATKEIARETPGRVHKEVLDALRSTFGG